MNILGIFPKLSEISGPSCSEKVSWVSRHNCGMNADRSRRGYCYETNARPASLMRSQPLSSAGVQASLATFIPGIPRNVRVFCVVIDTYGERISARVHSRHDLLQGTVAHRLSVVPSSVVISEICECELHLFLHDFLFIFFCFLGELIQLLAGLFDLSVDVVEVGVIGIH